MTTKTVADVLGDFDAMAAECGGLEAATIHAMTLRLSVAHAREVEALRQRAEAAEEDALERDAARYKWLRKHLVNWCPDDDTVRLSWHAREALDAEIDAAISGDDGEIVPSGCGVEARIHFEDPRYPTLVLDGDEFGTIGYELRRDTGELRRVCICHAHCEHECVCGYDAAISAEREG